MMDLGNVEEMTLAWGIDKAFTPRPEYVATKQRQSLSQFGMLFLQLIVIYRGPIEYAFELIGAALSIFGPPLGVFGLLPQLAVAAEQVFEELLILAWIIRKSRRKAHAIKNTRALM
jgi:hypothetical protein